MARRMLQVVSLAILIVYVGGAVVAFSNQTFKTDIAHFAIWALALPGAVGVIIALTAYHRSSRER